MIKTIKLSDINTDGTQSRAGLNIETVSDYAEAMRCGSKFPPIKTFYDGSFYWLADGFHRYFATKDIEAIEIESDVDNGTKEDALLYSLGANASHGLRRTNADKRHAVMIVLNHPLWSKWTNREVATECAVSHQFVNNLREELNAKLTEKVATVATTPTPMLEVAEKNDRNVESEPENILPVTDENEHENYTELDRLSDENKELSHLVKELNEKLAINNYEGTDDVTDIINNLKVENKNLSIELNAIKKARDSLLNENNQLKKQIAMQRKEIDKLSK